MSKKQQGFTLIELAIVLVVVGLILGMTFKGRDLIDGAKVKNMASQANKVQAAFMSYYERYGSYPGDGCTAAPAVADTVCPATNARNGLLTTSTESAAALVLLQNVNLVSASDLKSVTGAYWTIRDAGVAVDGYAANTNYLHLANADIRYVCALDRAIDDGVPNTGSVRSNATVGNTASGYNSDTAAANPLADCWSQPSTQVQVGVGLLP